MCQRKKGSVLSYYSRGVWNSEKGISVLAVFCFLGLFTDPVVDQMEPEITSSNPLTIGKSFSLS